MAKARPSLVYICCLLQSCIKRKLNNSFFFSFFFSLPFLFSSRDICESVSQRSRECNLFSFKFVRQSRDIRASVARHPYECRLVLFSRQIVARFSQDCRATVVRHSRDIRTSVAKISHCKFAKISRRQVRDTRTNVARPSHDCRATVLRNILEKKFA